MTAAPAPVLRRMTAVPSKLTRCTQTPWGYYAAGSPVIVMARAKNNQVLVCMDDDHHPIGLCHCLKLDADNVRPTRKLESI